MKITIAKYYTPSGRCIQALDYSHRNDDGSVGKVPDSLTHAFKTEGGRVVKDGGGIQPDVLVDVSKMSAIAKSLYEKDIIFEFANKYRNNHSVILPASEYKLNENEWEEFLKFIADKDYQYITETEKELNAMKQKAEEEKYFEAIKTDYESLKKKLSHDKIADLDKARNEIIELLELEITKRYYYQRASIESSFDDDQDIKTAIEVLHDTKRYDAILKAK